jgi:hypothetical protein
MKGDDVATTGRMGLRDRMAAATEKVRSRFSNVQTIVMTDTDTNDRFGADGHSSPDKWGDV